jgi:hypothetical protein
LNQEKDANQQLHHSLRREEEQWILKSRSLWIKEGDSNTSSFHRQAQNQRKKNTVTSILSSDGKGLDTFEQVKKETSQHFKTFYQQPNEEGLNEDIQEMLNNIPNIVSEDDNC